MVNKRKELRIIIYGAGEYGNYVYKVLTGVNNINIVAFCDRNSQMWNGKIGGKRILSPESILEAEDVDGIFIAIKDQEQVKSVIEKLTALGSDKKVYRKIEDLTAGWLVWDVSNQCNAKCKYCVTGISNREKKKVVDYEYTDVEMFEKIYTHIYDAGILSKNINIELCNWFEPFLNPNIIDIIRYLSGVNQKFILSTNASVFRAATDKDTYKSCERMGFSMPGFSQESYDRIHGFNFESIKENILKFCHDMRLNGFRGDFFINAHVYRFSVNEQEELQKWAEDNEIFVNRYFPYLNGGSINEKYYDGKLDINYIKNMIEDMYMSWDRYVSDDEVKMGNPICDQLAINADGSIALCCSSDYTQKDYNCWGDILSINSWGDFLKMKSKMLQSDTCIKCNEYRIAHRFLR